MDGGSLMSLAERFLGQDQDLAFSFSATAGDFVVVGFSASEAVNAPFEVTIELASQDADISLQSLLDTEACLGIFDKYSEPRYLHGVITEIEKGQSGIRRTFYAVTLRPSLHRLAHTSDSRIWQGKTIVEAAKEVLAEHNIVNCDWRLEATYQPREYVTQYRETALAFITRVLSEEGIFYMFKHSEAGHQLIFTDAPLATPVLEHAPSITCNTNTGGQSRGSWVSQFTQRERLRSSSYEMADYTFHNPAASMKTLRRGQELNGLAGDYPLYDSPGRYKDPQNVGDPFVKHRIEAVRVDATTGHGDTNNIHLSAGYHVSLTDHEDANVNASHFILGVSHSGQQTAALEEDAGGGPTTYQASFTTMPARLPYRPPLARKPVVDGPQIAMVTGPEGEEIYTDSEGRVKCHFFWDRRSNKDEHSSCWIRVSQNWAGGSWGHIAIPRIGHEVIVDYLEGDPDQPIVTGRTYHATNRPPYKLPEHKTRMSIKSQTHKGEGFNELRFEDENGREEVFVHAQKDRNEKTRNNHTERIDNNWVQSVGHNKSVQVEGDHDEIIGGNMTISVGPSKVGRIITSALTKLTQGVGSVAYSLGLKGWANAGEGNMNLFVEKQLIEMIGATRQTHVGMAYMLNSGHSIDFVAGRSICTQSGRDATESVGRNKYISVGDHFSIVCGQSSIELKSDGTIQISGLEVNISSEKSEISGSERVQITAPKIGLN